MLSIIGKYHTERGDNTIVFCWAATGNNITIEGNALTTYIKGAQPLNKGTDTIAFWAGCLVAHSCNGSAIPKETINPGDNDSTSCRSISNNHSP